MNCLRKSVLIVLVAIASALSVYAQSNGSTSSVQSRTPGAVTLVLKDAGSGEAVGFATVSLTVKGEEKPKYYVLSDDSGVASFAKVSRGTYILKAEIMGYKNVVREITMDRSALNLGEVKMEEDVTVLEAANVTATGNPIIVKKDTIEYNASSFKTSDNDMLEELLKKLPGVEVSEDGSITANGQTINKITIDGKTFFLDDPSLASKNIPAKIIEKVKVVEKKSDQAMFTGIDDGNEETVIDLSIRPGMMQGWFGNIMAGGGHDVPSPTNDMNDWRYQGAAMIGRFTDKSQLSIILNGNNTNNRGFNDMAGSMMGNMRGGGGGMGRGQGGWGRGNGITTSWMGGVNGAFTLLDGRMDLSANYLFNGTQKAVTENSIKETYMDDGSSLVYNNDGYSHTNSYGHRAGVRLDHKFSDNTSILFEPQFNYGTGNYDEYSKFSTYNVSADKDSTLTNNGFSNENGKNKNWTASGFLLFRQRLGKPGRTISLMSRYEFSNNVLDGVNQSVTRTRGDDDAAKDDVVNQKIDRKANKYSVDARLVYTEPLGKNFFIEANYSFGWNKNTSVKNAYNAMNNTIEFDGDLPVAITQAGWSTEADPTYSNDILNRYINQSFGANLLYQKDKFRAQLGFSGNPTNTHNETNGEVFNSKVIKWSPQAMLSYDFNDNSNLRFFYFGRSEQPTTSQLMPVPDNSNPLSISLGNPWLKPYFNHNMRGMFRYSNKQNFVSVNGFLSGGIVQDAITSATWYDSKGVQYSIPVNSKGSGNVDGRVMVNAPFGKSNFSMFSMTNARYSQSTSFIGTSSFAQNKASSYYDDATAEFDYDKFNNDFPDIYAANEDFTTNRLRTVSFTERLRFTYRNDFVELNLGGRTRMSKSWYTVASAQTKATWNNQVTGSMNWTLPWGMNLISQLDYNWYNGYVTPQSSEFVWNAEITQLAFKKKFTFAIKAYDILNQSKNLSITDASNYHQEVRNNTLGRYIIFSLTYRFGNFDQSKMSGGRRGGPMGPPPGR